MSIETGRKLGPYEVVAPIAAGGMGEVYKARDTRLERTVAVKVLPEHLSSRPELRERFEREARAVSALNHPHICVLYDVGRDGETDYLVMEYLEGETLAERLKRGPLSLEETLRAGMQMADALTEAHRHGIVHRDLKPGNVLLTKPGVKLLDFGLAVVRGTSGASSQLPTAEHPLTAEGAILGTLLYMAPEQLEGKEADERADVYALGAVLYEMATGVRYFEDRGRTLAPAAFEHLVKTCLARDRDERRQTAHDVLVDLKWIAEGDHEPGVAPERGRGRLALVAAGLVVGMGGAVAAGALVWKLALPPPRPLSHFVTSIDIVYTSDVAISRDGRTIVYLGRTERATETQLFRRLLHEPEPEPIRDTENSVGLFLSPDGEWVGFHTPSALMKINLSGGAAVTLVEMFDTHDGHWVGDEIVFSGSGQLFRVSASGGDVVPVPESEQELPHVLPDEVHALFTKGNSDRFGLRSLRKTERTLLADGEDPQYVSTGHILFLRQETLWGVTFDVGSLELEGEPTPLLDGVTRFSVSEDGTLAYIALGQFSGQVVAWVDREGVEIGPIGSPGSFRNPELSPDGTKLAVMSNGDIWVYDLERGVSTRITFEGQDAAAIWSPDGSRLAFSSSREGSFKLFEVPADGSGEVVKLFESPDGEGIGPLHWSSDGQYLIFGTGLGNRGIRYLTDGDSVTVLDTDFDEYQARLSPDGRFLTYVSNESGRHEVYVRSFPQSDRKWNVTNGGGVQPRWSEDGTKLYYLVPGGTLMEVAVAAEEGLSLGAPERLFETGIHADTTAGTRAQYDVSLDGQRFLINRNAGALTEVELHVVLDWFTELKEKMR